MKRCAACLALVAVAWLGCGDAGPSTDRDLEATAPAEAVASAASAPAEALCFQGAVVPERVVELSAEREGVLRELGVALGDRVRRGRTLARLDARAVGRDLDIARSAEDVAVAEEERARVRLRAATQELERQERLADIVSEGAIARARSARDEAQAELSAARARVDAARGEIARLTDLRSETALVAPFDGVVTGTPVDPGARVVAGETVVSLIGGDSPRVRFAVPRACAGALVPGTEVEVHGAQGSWAARVERAAPDLDPALAMFVHEAVLEAAAVGPAPGEAVAVAPAGSGGDCSASGRTALDPELPADVCAGW